MRKAYSYSDWWCDTCHAGLDDNDADDYLFYKKVTVRDAYGETLGVVENSRLSEEGVIAFAFRKMVGTTNLVDQLQVSVGPEKEQPSAMPDSTPTEVPETAL